MYFIIAEELLEQYNYYPSTFPEKVDNCLDCGKNVKPIRAKYRL